MNETEHVRQQKIRVARRVAMDLAKRGIVAGKEVAWRCCHGASQYGKFIRVSPTDANAEVGQNGVVHSLPSNEIELAEIARQEAKGGDAPLLEALWLLIRSSGFLGGPLVCVLGAQMLFADVPQKGLGAVLLLAGLYWIFLSYQLQEEE